VAKPSEENLSYPVIMIIKALFALLMPAYSKQNAPSRFTA